jgi:hypothetical protein
VLSHNIIMLTWTKTSLVILHNAIRISLPINIVFVVGNRRTRIKTGKSRKCYSIIGRNKNLFPRSFFQTVRTGFGNHLASNSIGRDGASLEINGRDMRLNHSVQFTAEFKNGWSYIYAPTYARIEYTKKNIFTLPLRRREKGFFIMDLGYTARHEAAVRFILCQQSINQSHKSLYPVLYSPGPSLSFHFL